MLAKKNTKVIIWESDSCLRATHRQAEISTPFHQTLFILLYCYIAILLKSNLAGFNLTVLKMSNQENTTKSEDFNKGKLLLSWSFPEFTKYERSKRWYITASAITILFLFYSVFTFNFLLAVIVVMAAMIVLMREKADPRDISFSITERGIEIGEKFYH